VEELKKISKSWVLLRVCSLILSWYKFLVRIRNNLKLFAKIFALSHVMFKEARKKPFLLFANAKTLT